MKNALRETTQKERDRFFLELSKRISEGWKMMTTSTPTNCSIELSLNMTLCFRPDEHPVLSLPGFKVVLETGDTIGQAANYINFDPAYRTFLVEKNIKELAKEIGKMRELLSNGIEFSPGSEAVKELEKEFDKLKTST